MPSEDKRAEYERRAAEAREAAKACANDQFKMVLYQIARLWDRLAGKTKVLIAAVVPAATSCCVMLSDCCVNPLMHCPHCWFHI